MDIVSENIDYDHVNLNKYHLNFTFLERICG